MLNKITILFFAMVLALGISKLYAQSDAVNVGNKICPVTGEKIDEKTKVTYEYQGKIYNFCCAACPPEFQKDPQKYIKKIEEEAQGKLQKEEAHDMKTMK